MAETVTPIEASNLHALHANFHTSASSQTTENQQNVVLNATGDYACSQEYDLVTNYSQTASYCPGTDIVNDLGTFLTTFGDVETVGAVTQLAVNFEAGIAPTVQIESHQHTVNPHVDGTLNTWDVSGVIPASTTVGVPALIAVSEVTAGKASFVSASVTFTNTHNDKPGATGDHFTGQSITGKCSLSISGVGTISSKSSITAGNWVNIKLAKGDSNTDQDTFTITADQYFTKN